MVGAVSKLYSEVVRRFPEVAPEIDRYSDLPYLFVAEVADWLASLPEEERTETVEARANSFMDWCEEQPREKDAGADILTIMVIAFVERLLLVDAGTWIRRLVPLETLMRDPPYWKQWVGEERYARVLALYNEPI